MWQNLHLPQKGRGETLLLTRPSEVLLLSSSLDKHLSAIQKTKFFLHEKDNLRAQSYFWLLHNDTVEPKWSPLYPAGQRSSRKSPQGKRTPDPLLHVGAVSPDGSTWSCTSYLADTEMRRPMSGS